MASHGHYVYDGVGLFSTTDSDDDDSDDGSTLLGSMLSAPTYTLKKELWTEYDPAFPRVSISSHLI